MSMMMMLVTMMIMMVNDGNDLGDDKRDDG